MTARGADRSQEGFTLTETLVAVALLAIIAAAAVPVLRGGLSAHARLTEIAAAREAHGALERTVRGALAAAVDAPGAGFDGQRDSLRFTAQPDGAASLLTITVSMGEGGVRLQAVPVEGGQARQETIAAPTPFAGFYFYGALDGGRPGWRQTWPGPEPPRLVVMDFEPGADGAPLRIEVRVGAGAALACDYDSGLQACREGI